MHVYVRAWGTDGLSIPPALPQIVNTAPTQEWSQTTGVGRGGLEGLNWEECPTSIVGKQNIGATFMQTLGLKTNKAKLLSIFLSEG